MLVQCDTHPIYTLSGLFFLKICEEECKTSKHVIVSMMCELQYCEPLVAWVLCSDACATSSSRHCCHAFLVFIFFFTQFSRK